jgi:hypothetical protein
LTSPLEPHGRSANCTGFPNEGFDVSTDGRQILFDRIRDSSDVVLIDLPK